MRSFKVGDICKVIDTGRIYTTYDEFAIKARHNDIVEKRYVACGGSKVAFNKIVRILYIKNHPTIKDRLLTIVETIDDTLYLKFIINVEGLELANIVNEESRFLEKYIEYHLTGQRLIKMIPDMFVGERLIEYMVLSKPMDIQYINPNLIKDADYGKLLRKDGGLLGLIPEDRRTLELCEIAIGEEEYAVRFIPEKLKGLGKGYLF